MARRVIDKGFVDKLTDAFARAPANASAAAKLAGCDHRTARRGWAVGWPKQGFRAISEVIAERQQAARALAMQRQADERQAEFSAAEQIAERARLDMAREREQDGQIARGAKGNALAALATSANLLKRGHKISQDLTAEDLAGLPPKDRIRALKVIAEFNREAVAAAEAAIKLERVIMGEPTDVIRHEHAHVHVEAKDMAATIEKANRALERAKQRGIIDTDARES